MNANFARRALLILTTLLLICADPALASDDPSPSMTVEPTQPELRGRLLDLLEKDQEARKELLTLFPDASPSSGNIKLENPSMEQIRIIMNVKAVETETTAFIKQVLDEHGFPTFDMVGADGANAAWMLIQHADADPEFQQHALTLMEPLVEAGQADPSDFAHLTDRVLLARGEKQRFATQFAMDDDGVLRPRPTEAPQGLAERRARYELLPLDQHVGLLAGELDVQVDARPMP